MLIINLSFRRSSTKDEWLLLSKNVLNFILHDGSIFDLYSNAIQEADKVILLLNNKEHEVLLTSLHKLLTRKFLKGKKQDNKVADKIKKIINKLQSKKLQY